MSHHAETCRRTAEHLITLIGNADPDTWRAPWHTNDQSLRPVNASTGRPYQAGNWLALILAAHDNAWTSGTWATYRQWQRLGRQVAKGQTGTRCVAVTTTPITSDHDRTEPAQDGQGRQQPRPRVRRGFKRFTVFAGEQLVPEPDATWQLPTPEAADPIGQRSATIDAWIARTGATIRHGGTRASYHRGHDVISTPPAGSFVSWGDYYATIGHELAHWTQHPDRCDRPWPTTIADYAREELVAEFTAAMLGQILGYTPQPQSGHEHYLAHWAALLADEPEALTRAASHAQAAADYLARFINASTEADPQIAS